MPKAGKNIYLRKDGRWEGRFVRDRVDGRIRYGYVFGKTREEVERRLPDRGSGAGKPGGPTFADTASDWLRVRRPQLKESSVSRYMNNPGPAPHPCIRGAGGRGHHAGGM